METTDHGDHMGTFCWLWGQPEDDGDDGDDVGMTRGWCGDDGDDARTKGTMSGQQNH